MWIADIKFIIIFKTLWNFYYTEYCNVDVIIVVYVYVSSRTNFFWKIRQTKLKRIEDCAQDSFVAFA